MIYLDVTSACRSSLNTGVKRVQRGWHGFLNFRRDYRPVRWNSRRHLYQFLDAEELATLEQARTPAGLGLFDSFAPGALKDWTSLLRLFPSPRQPVEFKTGDLLLLPDLLWDNRARFLPGNNVTGLRRIGVFHDAIALRLPAQARIDRYFCERAMAALALLDGVLCVSHEAEADLQRFWRTNGIAPAPTHFAPWPVPFVGNRPAANPNFAARRILYVARLEPHKNHLRFLQACESLWTSGVTFKLHLIGCLAYPDDAWKILRRVRALKKSGHPLTWRAHVPETALHQAYQECSFTAFPSLLEGFGLPILESLWHGRPVVCGSNGALGEVAQGGGCLAVDTSDASLIARGLRGLLEDEARYNAFFAETQTRTFRAWSDFAREISGFSGLAFPSED